MSMPPRGDTLSEMSSNHGALPTNESKVEGSTMDSIYNAIEHQQQQQLFMQQQQQAATASLSGGNGFGQALFSPAVGSGEWKAQQDQILAAVAAKRPADDASDRPSRSQKKSRNDGFPEDAFLEGAGNPNNVNMITNWGPNFAIEPTPLNSSGSAAAAASSAFANLDLFSNNRFPNSSGVIAPNLFAEQLRRSDAGAHHHSVLQDQMVHRNTSSLLGSLGTFDSYLPSNGASLQPASASNLGFFNLDNASAISSGNQMGHLMPPTANPGAQGQGQQLHAIDQPPFPTMASARDPFCQQQASLDLVMRQLNAAQQNPTHFAGTQNAASASLTDTSLEGNIQNSASAPIPSHELSNILAGPSTGSAANDDEDDDASDANDATVQESVFLNTISERPRLPPMDEQLPAHYSERPMFCLGVSEDHNWLSEFHCFVRSELTEVYRASQDDCKARNNAISGEQVGLRCRFCAHKPGNSRVGRASAFPSSLRQIYQSFTMMLREHFPNCDCIPPEVQAKFQALKDKPSQGATDSKRFWMYSAMQLGLTDSGEGIMVSEASIDQGLMMPPFGSQPGQEWLDDATKSIELVQDGEYGLVSEFMVVLLSQVQVVRLTEAERIGNRRSLAVGLPGLACRACCSQRRLGLCRLFPARRRTLPSKLADLYDHVRRCNITPQSVKDTLERLKVQTTEDSMSDRDESKRFFDQIWYRMGHKKSSLSGGIGRLNA